MKNLLVAIIFSLLIGFGAGWIAKDTTIQNRDEKETTLTISKGNYIGPADMISFVKVSDTRLSAFYDGMYHVKGKATNISKKNINNLFVSYNVYDYSGNILGDQNAIITSLPAGESWNFECAGVSEEISSYKIAKVTGYFE